MALLERTLSGVHTNLTSCPTIGAMSQTLSVTADLLGGGEAARLDPNLQRSGLGAWQCWRDMGNLQGTQVIQGQ